MAVQGVSHPERGRRMMMGAAAVVLLLPLCLSAASTDSSRNYYETLSVEPTATDSQIKRAFRKLAVKYHPDKNKGADAEKTFREILEAYSVLSNKEKRSRYDSVGHEAFMGNPVFANFEENTNTPFSFSDFFHDFSDSPFGEEGPDFSWSSFQDWENEDDLFEPHSFEGPAGFTFIFRDVEDSEDDYHNHHGY